MHTDEALRKRKTVKMLAPNAWSLPENPTETAAVAQELLELAGTAPVHYRNDKFHTQEGRLPGVVPWRFYLLDAAQCRQLATYILANAEKPGKMPNMLNAANALFQVTWQPDPRRTPIAELDDNHLDFEPTRRNMEHIAAASCAVQNLMLAATARGLTTYWSSGGMLREPAYFDMLGMPQEEILLGSIFWFPSEPCDADLKFGGLANHKGAPETWSKSIELNLPE
ncbi:MAG: nitroreductase family protein [Bacteroidota bacterium]